MVLFLMSSTVTIHLVSGSSMYVVVRDSCTRCNRTLGGMYGVYLLHVFLHDLPSAVTRSVAPNEMESLDGLII